MTTSILISKLNFINQGNEKEHVKISNTAMFHKHRLMIDLYRRKDSSYKAWPDTKTKHTTGKSKPKLVSGRIVRLIHQSITKRHQFENCDYHKVCMADGLNGQALPVHHTKPYKKYSFQNDGTSRYFGL